MKVSGWKIFSGKICSSQLVNSKDSSNGHYLALLKWTKGGLENHGKVLDGMCLLGVFLSIVTGIGLFVILPTKLFGY
jgi:hypothetical protein